MSLPAIEVTSLAKRYVLEHESRHDSLRDTLHHAARKLWRRARWGTGFEKEEFWALRDVSFSVQPGEVVGIIGRNGAGKSTLLKILSRITEPTAGRIALRGRVASLLEVGTGFHPDLSGRENIYLNGAILGMSRLEIRANFDEIVAFAEIERFLDTPVKRYSSGMYVRLAFAIAAHLEPEILIVDEVLAVGDAQFQKKCLGKMRDVANSSGRTVLFVSHNLGAVQSLCTRGLYLEKGVCRFVGPIDQTVDRYLRAGLDTSSLAVFSKGEPAVRVDQAAFIVTATSPVIEVDITIRSATARRVAVEFALSTGAGTPVGLATSGTFDPDAMVTLISGDQAQRWRIDVSNLANGAYQLNVQLVEPMIQILTRIECPTLIEVCRGPSQPGHRVMEQAWQAGAVELPCIRS
ncbi:MAG: ABC transporter ATP-binding protein [Undibacterium sp.]|nr:ABC transporter ATP-binding protein [Opitutaceae bacterium]